MVSSGYKNKVQAGPTQSFTPAGTGLMRKCTLCNTPRLLEDSEFDAEGLTLQRSPVEQAEPSTVPTIVHEVLRSPGQPLDSETRAFMEPRFGHDFSKVQVHDTTLIAIQTKLTIGQPNDRYEQEANLIANQVMAAPVHTGVTCAPQPIQRFLRQSNGPMDSTPVSVNKALSSNGVPLEPALRQDMEQRFGQDFSGVRVHTDAKAAESAKAVNALAYTVGRDVVFRSGQYQPGTGTGRQLLAHELAHVVQQQATDGMVSIPASRTIDDEMTLSKHGEVQMVEQFFESPSPVLWHPQQVAITPLSATRSPVVQRAVSPDMPAIRDMLSLSDDNLVTESDAHQVLVILKGLRLMSEHDFRDTVAAMQREGLVQRLLTSVSQADRLEEQETLRQIANARVFMREQRTGNTTVTTTVTGSCSPERYRQIYVATMQALRWLDRAIALTDDFLSEREAEANTDTRQAFILHFRSTATDVVEHVRGRLDRIRHDIQFGRDTLLRSNPFTEGSDPFIEEMQTVPVECHSTWDPMCIRRAMAYINLEGRSEYIFCESFFQQSEPVQVSNIIHEMAHWQRGGAHITDRGYAAYRVLRYLSTAERLTNAESYNLYVGHLAGQTPAIPAPRDTREDCPDDWWTILQRTIARAQLANSNAALLTTTLTPGDLQNWTEGYRQLLGGNTQNDIDRAKNVFDQAVTRFALPVDFQCEPEGGGRCDRSETYWYARGDFHICPSWRALGSDQAWIISLLAGLYGYFDLENNNTRRRNYARLAYGLTQEQFSVPTLPEVLGSPA
jgi:hypothetical protein